MIHGPAAAAAAAAVIVVVTAAVADVPPPLIFVYAKQLQHLEQPQGVISICLQQQHYVHWN